MRHQPFDPSKVKLTGTNLIEASAGTGKTYSIAIMVLRLLLEEKLPVKEILMVTFTKAAVAELEERIRAFIRAAYRVSTCHSREDEDETIRVIVLKQVEKDGTEKVASLLRQAVLFLDETAIMTIHGFCQQMLTEFAFETGQVFGAETLKDPALLLQEQVNKFWRKEVTTMPEPLLETLLQANLSRKLLNEVISEHLRGKRYLPYEEGKIYDCRGDQHEQWIQELQELQEKEQELNNSVHEFIKNNREKLLNKSDSDRYAKKAFSPLIDNPKKWIKTLQEKVKDDTDYAKRLFPDIIAMCNDCDKAKQLVQKQKIKILSHLYCMAIAQVSKSISEAKQRQNLVAFDDMIEKVHAALTSRPNLRLVESLQQKYKAVFIDEFQDTDKHQYEIFETAFRTNTIVFYIGDPKQSIYAWRKADLQTYFRARNSVGQVYDMNINYRSSGSYIEAMNEFFGIDDPFFFNAHPDGIDYINVDAPTDSSKGTLLFKAKPASPISIAKFDDNKHLNSGLAGQVIQLLEETLYQIPEKGKLRAVRPSDIGILVRTNKDGERIKRKLAKYGIPSITIGEAKVLQSDEAKMVWHLLIAMEEPARGNINRALVSPLTGINVDSILHFKEDVLTDVFRSFRKTWEEAGVYTAMMNLVERFNIRGHLLSGDTEHGERSITNLFQLIELIHKVQVRQNFSALELIAWLKRGIDGMTTEGDEFEQRVESDEESIKIVTIHKSKGLEYNIVFCPSLDQDGKSNDTSSFMDPNRNEYVSVETVNLGDDQKRWVDEQQMQEKRRIIYVAITRAVYKCFVYTNKRKSTNSAVGPFIIGRNFSDYLFDLEQPSEPPESYRYKADLKSVAIPLKASQFLLVEPNWRKVSYSSLAAKQDFRNKPTLGGQLEAFDRFMFYQLTKGAHTGNMLHFIFENVHFENDSSWNSVIDKAITQFAPSKRDSYSPLLRQLLDTVIHVPIKVNDTVFTLSEIEAGSRIHEFEFDFTIDRLTSTALNALSSESISIAVKDQSEMVGLMNGLVDLLFLHNEKYYILDWKSNYLGDQMEDYSPQHLAEAMNENNYHLQYLLYTIAVRRYLQSRLGQKFEFRKHFGGVIYLFVRGIRKDQTSGIFTTVPSPNLLTALDAIFSNKSSLQLSAF